MSKIVHIQNLKTPGSLESQNRRFTSCGKSKDNIEEKNKNFDSLGVFRKTNIIEKKEKSYLNEKNHSINSSRKIRNLKSANLMKNTNEYSNNSPLNSKYKSLLKNISFNFNYNCLKHLTNQDLDFLFDENNENKNLKNQNNSSMILQPVTNKKINYLTISKSLGQNKNYNLFRYYNKNDINSSKIVSNLKRMIQRPSISNVFIKKKLKKSSSYIINDKNKISSTKNYLKNRLKNSRKLVPLNVSENEDINSRYKKFVGLLKKQTEKNKKLLNEMRREQCTFQDRLKVSVGLFSGYKAKKFIFYRDNKNS